ncbi:MAG: phosphoglycerate dehydrogenase [Oscillospiraceae bacterium]|jgi:D-3-phosphoglycerate dehydrogenase|nr:phosphoglycerate dehydrogenase [Oscillospiraceae bacterium]
MYTVKTLNKIAAVGLLKLPGEHFRIDGEATNPDAIILRSASMHEMELPSSLLCVGRAGAGVNNIPVDKCSDKAIVVFNTPGANANAVRELTLCGLFLASRDIIGGVEWAKTLTGDDVAKQVEKGKGQFVGPEIQGKTLGVIGLGAIGVGVANAAHHIGMDVLGFDPYISVDSAWVLSRNVRRAKDIRQIFAESDYLTLHVPASESTKKDLADMLGNVRPGVRILNFARGELLNTDELLRALDDGTVARYITDFPDERLARHPKVVPIPHLGASTPESEDNCAVMACDEVREYLMYGTIRNAVNMPDTSLPYLPGYRLCVAHRNIPNMLSTASAVLGDAGLNIESMLSKSKKDYAYTLMDISDLPKKAIIQNLESRDGILRVRVLKLP